MLCAALSMVVIFFAGWLPDAGAKALGGQQDTITVMAGYYGGPYVELGTYHYRALEAKYAERFTYSLAGNEGRLIMASVEGITLENLMRVAGFRDLGIIQRFHFHTADRGAGEEFSSHSRAELLDQALYYYPYLLGNYDFTNKVPLPGAFDRKVLVPPMLAMRDYRPPAFTDPDPYLGLNEPYVPDYSAMKEENRFRLYYGMKPSDLNTNTNRDSAYWVYEVRVELAGAPSLTGGKSLRMEVGQTSQLKVEVGTHNLGESFSAIVELVKGRLRWSSSDPSVAKVDNAGRVTMLKEGSATITAEFGDAAHPEAHTSVDFHVQTEPTSAGDGPPDESTSNSDSSSTSASDSTSASTSKSDSSPSSKAPSRPASTQPTGAPSENNGQAGPGAPDTQGGGIQTPQWGHADEPAPGEAVDPGALPQAAQVYVLPQSAQMPEQEADEPAQDAGAAQNGNWTLYEIPGAEEALDVEEEPMSLPTVVLTVSSLFLLGAAVEVLLCILRR